MHPVAMRFLGLAGLIVVSGLCSTWTEAAAAGIGGGDSEFDFLMLTREWPFSFCTVTTCHNKQLLQSKFNIHGLWAETNDSKSDPPMFCKATFNESELNPIRDELQKSWMDLKDPNGSSLSFWREEFKKHGSCVTTDPRFNSTYKYFRTALLLNQKYNLIEMLKHGGVVPSSTPIDASKIRSALSDSFGFKPMVRCSNAEDGQAYLYELRICFAKDLSPKDCADAPHSRAGHMPASLQGLMEKLSSELRQVFLGLSDEPPRPRHASGTYECHDGEMVLLPVSAGL